LLFVEFERSELHAHVLRFRYRAAADKIKGSPPPMTRSYSHREWPGAWTLSREREAYIGRTYWIIIYYSYEIGVICVRKKRKNTLPVHSTIPFHTAWWKAINLTRSPKKIHFVYRTYRLYIHKCRV
jgi:hypothetical protein